MCLSGGMAAGGLVFAQWWLCPGYGCADDATCVCCIVAKNPPWTLLAGLATLPAVALGWFWRTDERNQEFRNAEESGRADRFVRYAEMLGADNVSVLGGIHGLTHLAMEDPKRRELVRDTLCSFIRGKVPRNARLEDEEHQFEDEYLAQPALGVVTSLEALSALRAVGADLRNVDLENIDTPFLALPRADLTGARLRRAVLRSANLSGVKLSQANCHRANFMEADLSGASIGEAWLPYANFYGANFANADLRRVDLSSADLRGANFEGAMLDGAKLGGATITGARMSQEQLDSTEGTPQDLPVFRPVKFE